MVCCRPVDIADQEGLRKKDPRARPRPLYDIPYMFEAREFLRKKLICKKVIACVTETRCTVVVDQPKVVVTSTVISPGLPMNQPWLKNQYFFIFIGTSVQHGCHIGYRWGMHSTDYAIARCLSVCPSVTCRYCVKTAKHIKLFHNLLATPFWFFNTKWYGSILTRTKSGIEYRNGMKKHDFQPVSRYISEMIQDSYNGVLIGTYTHTLIKGVISNDSE